MTYRIKDWDDTFEDFRSRAVKDLHWVPFPIRQDSEAFLTLLGSPEGREAYAVFITLVQIAARCPVRGRLEDEKGDLTPQRISLRLRIPVPVVQAAIDLLRSPEIGWLVPCGGGPDRCVDAPERRAQGTKDDSTPGAAPSAPVTVPPVSRQRASTEHRSTIDNASTGYRRGIDGPSHTEPDQTRPDNTEPKPPERPPNARTGEHADQPAEVSTGPLSGLAGRLVKPKAENTQDRAAAARDALFRRGVGEPALSALSRAPRLTAAIVEEVYAEAAADETVRNVTRVLVSRLASHLGIDIPRRAQGGERAGRASPAVAIGPMGGDLADAVERIRRRRGA